MDTTKSPAELAAVPCSAPDHCKVCGLDVPENEPLYWCEVCGQNHCDHCGDSWRGDDEDDKAFAGMYLECVCDHCLNEGFVPPESARARKPTSSRIAHPASRILNPAS